MISINLPFLRISVLCLILTCTSQALIAQKELELKDAVLKRFSDFYPTKPTQLQWVNGEDKYYYIEEAGDSTSLVVVDAETGTKQRHVTLSKLSELLGTASLKTFPMITWLNGDMFYFQNGPNYYVFDTGTSTLERRFALPENAAHVHFNKQFTRCAFIVEGNLYVLDNQGKQVQLTSDGGEGIVYGQAVHRNEFGIHEGIFWSEQGSSFAFYRMDETMVEDYPLVHTNSVPAQAELFKYPMAGRKSHHVTIGIYRVGSPVIYLKTPEPLDHYLTNLAWVPDGKFLLVAELNRDQDHMLLNRYDATSGQYISTLFEEKHNKYVEPETPPIFLKDKPGEFLWFSERNGYQHLFRYTLDGKLLGQLTNGDWEVQEVLGFGPESNYLFVEGMGESKGKYNPTQHYIYRINFATGVKTLVDSTLGWHEGWLSTSGKYIIQEESSISIPREISLFTSDGGKIRTIHSSKDPFADYSLSKPEILPVSAKDGAQLYARIIKPFDFDPAKKYPALVYVYNGPHVQLVQNRYLGAAPPWMYYLANRGYIVFTIDGRGSANRGLNFENAVFRQLGKLEMEDQMTGYSYLVNLPYVNSERIGIHGWSYGGFMTINLMLSHPGKFSAGVAGGPVTDWKFYEVMYTERYMDTPESNQEGYQLANLNDKVKNLEDDLLIIHGTADDVVVWQHSLAFLKSAVDHDIQLDYFVYPGHKHNVLGKDRAHLMKKVIDYITERL